MGRDDSATVHVKDLASQLGVDVRTIWAKLEAMGELDNVGSPSRLEAPVADRLRAEFAAGPVGIREGSAGWRQLSRRGVESSDEDEMLYEDVPAHLSQPLVYWLKSFLERSANGRRKVACAERKAGRIAARVRLDLRSAPVEKATLTSRYEWSDAGALVYLASTLGGTVLLDAVDATLADGVDRLEAEELERLLAGGGSAWHVTPDATALRRRVNPEVQQALQASFGTASATHLNSAWTAAYGRHPDPSLAYSQAIKAVEAAAVPVVLPHDRLATLGKVIGELRQNQQRWQLAIAAGDGCQADITSLLAMLRLLWEGQTDHHGSSVQPLPVTRQAAEAAVHLALTLVHWFQSQTVTRLSALT